MFIWYIFVLYFKIMCIFAGDRVILLNYKHHNVLTYLFNS